VPVAIANFTAGHHTSYPVLSMSFVKMLTMSGIGARWADRDPNTSPMIMVGGLSYGAPEVLAPVVDWMITITVTVSISGLSWTGMFSPAVAQRPGALPASRGEPEHLTNARIRSRPWILNFGSHAPYLMRLRH
jgi:hypothetical protein